MKIRIALLLLAALLSAPLSRAENASPGELAAQKIYSVFLSADLPKVMDAMMAGMGQQPSPIDKAAIVELMKSKEVEGFIESGLLKTYSPDELVAIAEILSHPAYKIYQDRLPALTQAWAQPVMAYLDKAFPEAQKRAMEKLKAQK